MRGSPLAFLCMTFNAVMPNTNMSATSKDGKEAHLPQIDFVIVCVRAYRLKINIACVCVCHYIGINSFSLD